VIVRSISGEATGLQTGFVDTGADITLVSIDLLQTIRADKQYHVRLRSHWGEWLATSIYLVDLEINDMALPGVEVAADESNSMILLGRNVLNKLILLLDGPNQRADVLPRRPVKF
jgi:predicted aspartyl protease